MIKRIFRKIANRIIEWASDKKPDFIIGGRKRPYLIRWYLIPRNRFFNAYVHLILRSDDDRALHDHPWLNCSILLFGQYTEHTIKEGGVHCRLIRKRGDIVFRSGSKAHRLEINDGPCWTLFLTGPRYRQWGFHCPEEGWVHWEKFTAKNDSGDIGKGCAG